MHRPIGRQEIMAGRMPRCKRDRAANRPARQYLERVVR